MKFVIWFVSLLALALIQTVLRESGVMLGGIPTAILYAAAVWTASSLSSAYDRKRAAKSQSASGTK